MMESFKHNYEIEDTGQQIQVSLIESEAEFKEFLVKIKSDKEIKAGTLADVLEHYSVYVKEEIKSSNIKVQD